MTDTTTPNPSDLTASLKIFDERLKKVEKDLNLECREMRKLVEDKHPEFGSHLNHLSESLSELHSSLNDVREKLSLATNTENAHSEPSSSDSDAENSIDPRTQSHIRHDEKITLSGIFRALLMADEPKQRQERKKLNE